MESNPTSTATTVQGFFLLNKVLYFFQRSILYYAAKNMVPNLIGHMQGAVFLGFIFCDRFGVSQSWTRHLCLLGPIWKKLDIGMQSPNLQRTCLYPVYLENAPVLIKGGNKIRGQVSKERNSLADSSVRLYSR